MQCRQLPRLCRLPPADKILAVSLCFSFETNNHGVISPGNLCGEGIDDSLLMML